MTTLLDRQREHKLTDAMLTGLDLLVRHGSAMRYRSGWGFGSLNGPIVAPATMDALFDRGFARRRHASVDVTKSGRAAHAEITRGAA